MRNILPVLANSGEPSLAFVCMLGIVVVFVGLICIVGIIMIMNILCTGKLNRRKSDDEAAPLPVAAAPAAPVYTAPAAPAPIENRSELVAAVCAAIAEEEGTDISAIRVISFKKIN